MGADERPDGRLRILCTVHHDLVRGAGAPGATVALGEELERRGHRVEVVGLDLLGGARGATRDALRFPRAVARLVHRRLERRDLDVVDASTGDLAWVSVATVRAAPTAVLTRSHGLEPLAAAARRAGAAAGEQSLRWRYRLYHGGYRLHEVTRSLRAADAVLVLNDAEAAYATGVAGIAASRVARTAPLVRDGLAVRPRAEERDVLVLGPATWRKGGDVAVSVLTALLRADPTASASWAGLDDPAATVRGLDDDVRDRVRASARYGADDLAMLLASHRVLMFATRSEGLPVTLLEALSSGICVVGSDVPGVRDLLGGGAGALVPSGHVEGFVGAVRRLLGDDAARARCADVAAHVVAAHRTGPVVDRLEATYRAVLASKPAAS